MEYKISEYLKSHLSAYIVYTVNNDCFFQVSKLYEVNLTTVMYGLILHYYLQLVLWFRYGIMGLSNSAVIVTLSSWGESTDRNDKNTTLIIFLLVIYNGTDWIFTKNV